MKGKTGNPRPLKNLKVLAAEDNEFNQLIIKAQSKELGFDLIMSNNGKEALQKLKENDIDLILMDINMPVMDGFEAVKNIRSNFPAPKNNVPIIAITAYGLIYNRDQALEAGMDEYIAKPFSLEELKHTICKVLGINDCLEINPTNVKNTEKSIIFDLTEIRELYNNKERLVKQTVETFIINTQDGFNKISITIHDNLPETLKILHKIKSSFPYMGMHQAYEELLEIEGYLKAGIRLEEAKNKLLDMKEMLNDVYQQLRKEIGD